MKHISYQETVTEHLLKDAFNYLFSNTTITPENTSLKNDVISHLQQETLPNCLEMVVANAQLLNEKYNCFKSSLEFLPIYHFFTLSSNRLLVVIEFDDEFKIESSGETKPEKIVYKQLLKELANTNLIIEEVALQYGIEPHLQFVNLDKIDFEQADKKFAIWKSYPYRDNQSFYQEDEHFVKNEQNKIMLFNSIQEANQMITQLNNAEYAQLKDNESIEHLYRIVSK